MWRIILFAFVGYLVYRVVKSEWARICAASKRSGPIGGKPRRFDESQISDADFDDIVDTPGDDSR